MLVKLQKKLLHPSNKILIFYFISIALTANDPYEDLNRNVFQFNESLDKNFAKPIAETYDEVTPNFIQNGITNFFRNILEVDNTVNQILQGKPRLAVNDFSRLIINSSIGLFGLIDVASNLGLERHREDFGQTLGKWGVPQGPYIMLPLFGPSTPRDLAGRPITSLLSGTFSIDDAEVRLSLTALDALETRDRLLEVENLVIGDKYNFVRDSYLQASEFEAKDGVIEEDAFLDDMDNFFIDDLELDSEENL
jgi:phospholipid-binding lipoprotein MlaA